MIKTITLDAFIEKRVKGEHLDEISYHIDSVSMTSAGVGIKVSRFLKSYDIDTQAFIIAGRDISGFIKRSMQDYQIPCTIMETKEKGKTKMILTDDNVDDEFLNEEVFVKGEQLQLFSSIVEEKIEAEDVVVFEYNGSSVDKKAMTTFFNMLSQKSKVQIFDIHPNYWNLLKKDPVNVLIVNEAQCREYFHKNGTPLSEMIALLSSTIAPLAKIVIFTLQVNDFLIFAEGKIYRAFCDIKNLKSKIYKEALICGVIKCYAEDGDLRCLSEECICLSVGMDMGGGNCILNQNEINILKNKVQLYSI